MVIGAIKYRVKRFIRHRIYDFSYVVRNVLQYFSLAGPITKDRLFVIAKSKSEIRRWSVNNNIYYAFKSGFIVHLKDAKQLRGHHDIMLAVLTGARDTHNYTDLLCAMKDRVKILLLGYNLSNELKNIISERSGMRSERY